jgi:GxxExxY protein
MNWLSVASLFSARPLCPSSIKGVRNDCSYRLDLLVDPQVIVELKAVDRIDSIHEAQLLSYLKLSGYPVGLLINFNVRLLKEGLRRLVLGLKE